MKKKSKTVLGTRTSPRLVICCLFGPRRGRRRERNVQSEQKGEKKDREANHFVFRRHGFLFLRRRTLRKVFTRRSFAFLRF
jgi:hypothetical protein